MITDYFLTFIITLLQKFFSLFPVVTELPFGIDSYVVYAVGLFKGFMAIFPPFGSIFVAFTAYLGFRLVMMLFGIIPIFGKIVNAHKTA